MLDTPKPAAEFGYSLLGQDGLARLGEINTPRGLIRTPAFMPVGTVATVKALGLKASAGIPGHGSEFTAGPYTVLNSYHCSRLNTNTGRLTPAMFEAVFERARTPLET